MPLNFITSGQASRIEARKPIYQERAQSDQPNREQIAADIVSHLTVVAKLLYRPGETIGQVMIGKRLRTARLGGQAVKNYQIPAGAPDPDCNNSKHGGITASPRIMLRLDTIGPVIDYSRDSKNNPVIEEGHEPFDISLYGTYNIVTTPSEVERLVPNEGRLPSGLMVGTDVVDKYFELLQKLES